MLTNTPVSRSPRSWGAGSCQYPMASFRPASEILDYAIDRAKSTGDMYTVAVKRDAMAKVDLL